MGNTVMYRKYKEFLYKFKSSEKSIYIRRIERIFFY